MEYKIGDVVVHKSYGLGKIIGLEEKELAGATRQYYIVEVNQLQLWVPVEEAETGSIRRPLDRAAFNEMLETLRQPGEDLPDHQFQRKLELQKRMKEWDLDMLCRVIRDLAGRAGQHSLNQNDAAVLLRAQQRLLDEWVIALGGDRAGAEERLKEMLNGSQPAQQAT